MTVTVGPERKLGARIAPILPGNLGLVCVTTPRRPAAPGGAGLTVTQSPASGRARARVRVRASDAGVTVRSGPSQGGPAGHRGTVGGGPASSGTRGSGDSPRLEYGPRQALAVLLRLAHDHQIKKSNQGQARRRRGISQRFRAVVAQACLGWVLVTRGPNAPTEPEAQRHKSQVQVDGCSE
eukprot:766433-Hanusia_phi.AAC.3